MRNRTIKNNGCLTERFWSSHHAQIHRRLSCTKKN